jgi:hypothetical protein
MEGSLVAYKVFTNGSTLQASEVNDNLMKQAVAVFSNAAARTAAITSPVEGQMTYLEDVDRYDHWNGSAWVSPFGLTKLATSSFSSATSVSVNNVFTSEFRNYKVVYRIDQSSPGARLDARLSISGTPTATGYNWTYGIMVTAFAVVGRSATNSGTSIPISSDGLFGTKYGELTFINPQVATITQVNSSGGSGGGCLVLGSGDQFNSTSFDGFTIFADAGNITGTLTVYGLRN